MAGGPDPGDAGSLLVIESVGRVSGEGMVIQWQSVPDKVYGLSTTPNLSTDAFAPIEQGIPATPPMNTHTDAAAIGPTKYYKITLEK